VRDIKRFTLIIEPSKSELAEINSATKKVEEENKESIDGYYQYGIMIFILLLNISKIGQIEYGT
jgi:hypothetical protein